jgi:hypothetical protein
MSTGTLEAFAWGGHKHREVHIALQHRRGVLEAFHGAAEHGDLLHKFERHPFLGAYQSGTQNWIFG